MVSNLGMGFGAFGGFTPPRQPSDVVRTIPEISREYELWKQGQEGTGNSAAAQQMATNAQSGIQDRFRDILAQNYGLAPGSAQLGTYYDQIVKDGALGNGWSQEARDLLSQIQGPPLSYGNPYGGGPTPTQSLEGALAGKAGEFQSQIAAMQANQPIQQQAYDTAFGNRFMGGILNDSYAKPAPGFTSGMMASGSGFGTGQGANMVAGAAQPQSSANPWALPPAWGGGF